MNYQEIEGDLITLAQEGKFDVIAHGCNCMSNMGAGIAPQMAKAFNCDKFHLEHPSYRGDINKLGCIDFIKVITKFSLTSSSLIPNTTHSGISGKIESQVVVINAYTQYKYGRNHSDGDKKPIDYEALILCMRKINHIFEGKHIGLPKIGAGLAGGDWVKIKKIIQSELVDMKVTIVNYKK